MADSIIYVKGSQLPVAVSVANADFFIMVVGGATKSFTYEKLLEALGAALTLTGPEIVGLLEALSGTGRLNASNLKNSVEAVDYNVDDADTVTLPARTRLMEYNFLSETDQVVSIGTSADGTEIIDTISLTADTPFVYAKGDYFVDETTLHVTCEGAFILEIVKYSKP